ncbi:hypothetical protein SLEP1_g43818 [Rubroshorea leprosula]|uniref:Remorin C-terminal domain-containing protein n=2 Tax=Rubroshorea leprosula TaxID=152421 RepID=A0AAV5LES1_9ROSI|nr:hypothetical protein SLEP1_g43818 [Rubroshorea leprosula]
MQRRVSFAGPGQGVANSTARGRTLLQQTEPVKGGNWFQRQYCRQMSQVYDPQASEHAVAVTAVAFSIYSLVEAEMERQRKIREELEKSRTKRKSKKEDKALGLPGSSGVSNREEKNEGGTLTRKPTREDYRVERTAFPSSQPGNMSSTRPATTEARNRKDKGNSSRNNAVESKEDSWERAQMENINKRCERIKSSILAWENQKKMQAKIKMDRRKSELEQRRTRNQQHYEAKISRIHHVAGGARAQLEAKRRNEELEIKEKAGRMRVSGNVPAKCCFCF